ncbi:uncharacterized protein CBL_11277 [Carabus blaptoides fortunei]
MKNKPIRHKDENTFKFRPFAERIADINVDIFHRVAHPNEEEESDELECFFHQAIQKWNVLNLTESYEAFRKEVYGVITLPQLLHKKEHIVDVLLKHLKLRNPLSLQPLLEIVVALAKDLRKDFYPYYSLFLNQLIDLLHTKDTEQLEWLFTCLAYLFKFLWRYLIKDIDTVFVSLLPLLSDNRPTYIHNFAAESFAFVARKVKDRASFLALLLKCVESRKDGISGCGQLLFDVVRGISGHFHSCAESTLCFYFESLCYENLPQEVLFNVLVEVINNVCHHVHSKNTEVFWNSLISSIDKALIQWQKSSTIKSARDVEALLKLTHITLEYKQGRMLNSSEILVKQYLKLVALDNLPENVLLVMSKVGSLLLTSKSVQLAQEHASSIVRKTLAVENKVVMLDFIENLTVYSSFEALVLPVFLKYYTQSFDTAALRILTKLILEKSPATQNGIGLDGWNKYPLDFASNSVKVLDHLLSFLSNDSVENILDNIDNFLCALICVPHLNALNNKVVFDILTGDIKLLLSRICGNKFDLDKNDMQKLLFILNSTIDCAIHISDADMMYAIIKETKCLDTVLDLVQLVPYTIACLRILDMCLTSCRETKLVSMKTLKSLDEKLLQFFSSPYHQVRLLTCHVYSLFESLAEFQHKATKEDWNVFSLCYNTESIEPLVHTYRDQLQNLQKLAYDKTQGMLCQDTEFNTVPLRYLLGALYMNFQLIWEPIINIITSYAHGMNVNQFWEIFSKELLDAVERIQQETDTGFNNVETECEFIADLYANMFRVEDKPDYNNYRMLLWKAMANFPDIAEARSRDVSVLLLSFIEDEYRKSNANEAITWNIKQNEHSAELEEPEDDEDAAIKKELTTSVKFAGKSNLKPLLCHLVLFTKVRSPKTMFRELELYKLYFDLLSHRNAEVQKTALDCIMVYKHKYLTPYREHLYALIDDKQFKNELAMFRIDKETTVVQEEHRANLIPIVLRIVHSKMMAKTGMRTGGKASGQMRRNLVLRFLAGCHEDEMMQFIHMAFKYYAPYLTDDDPEIMTAKIVADVNLERFIPPKRLQSTLNLLLVIQEQFGGLMGHKLLRYLLKILLVVGAAVLGASKQKSSVHAGYWASLRNVRTTCQTILARFFGHFEAYSWSATELNATFDVFVWPWLDKLTIEGIHSPTALLKLFYQWCVNPRYFSLLVKHETGNKAQYPLPHIINLLVATKLHPSVTNTILEMLEKLLLLKVDETETAAALVIDNVTPVADYILQRLNLNEKLNYGSCILLPFVPQILERFKKKLANKNKGISQRELFILSRISELVWEADISDTVLSLVLPLVVRRASGGVSDETILQLVTTVYNLIKNVSAPHKHLRKIAPLFCEVRATPTRKLLCEMLFTIREKSDEDLREKLTLTSDLIKELNAFDKKWLDQPDFQRRHDAFQKVNELITSDAVNLELGILIIYNCFYIIRNENDLALRESAIQCLRNIVPHLAYKYQHSTSEKDLLVNEILFQLIRKGFRSKNERYRHEAISLLGHMARECADVHVVLKDLAKFANKQDLEVDFFENLQHLQLYRQTRALNRFNQICKELTVPLNSKSLAQFILPLVSGYLLTDKFASKNSLIDASIEGVKMICHMLPWHQYEGVLKFYLSRLRFKLEFQKQLVRLTVAILDAYHFDISKAQNVAVDLRNKQNDVKMQETMEEVKETENAEASKEKVEANKEETEDDDDEGSIEDEEQEIDEVLDDVEDTLLEVEEEVKNVEIPAIERQSVLCPSAARRVMFSIKTVLLPQLHRAMAEMTHHEGSHKVNRKRTGIEREEEELQKVPISLAVVKLLQKLPVDVLERNLPGVFMKLCTFLKSHLESVRRVTRETLQKIMTTLGPKYLGLLISEMSSLLSRGFQVHVLVFTIHAVLTTLKDMFQPMDVDKCLLTILEVCKADLFGAVADEKEVAKIVSKVSEAKSAKSYDTFQILAQYITDKCLMDLLLLLKDVLTHTHSFKMVNKVQECLRRIVLGLVDNTFIPIESLLVFAYGTASESIPQFIANTTKPQLSDVELEKKSRQKEDCFIIPKPKVYRSGNRVNLVRVSLRTNAHLLVEFGLRLCFFILKREKLKDSDFLTYIDPFVSIFKNCLSSRHVKMCTLTIQCLSWVMKYELPAMKEHIKEISAAMFELLHKYAAAGLSKGDNFDLVVAAFKTMAVLVRDVKYHTIDTEQLKALLLYTEQDLHDFERQATAFALLKAIILRKLIIPEIHDVMNKVAELSITSELPHVRLQCRQVFHQFLMDYPLGKKLDKHLAFYMSQLNYETQPGRESALEMIYGVVNSFPILVLKRQAGMFFVLLGARLVNDETPECRKMVAKCIQCMLERIDKPGRDTLFDILKSWFKDKKISHRRLAAQLCGILITVEKSNFNSRIPELVPLIKSQFSPYLDDSTPGRFVRLIRPNDTIMDDNDEQEAKPRDHQLFQVLQMLLKLCANCPTFLDRTDDIEVMAQFVQTLLAYPHEWVRIAAAQFIGYVLSVLRVEHVANLLLTKQADERGYLYNDPQTTVKSLTLDLCAQLQPGHVKAELAEQVIKNLVFMARVLQQLPISNSASTDEDDDENKSAINLFWLTKRMRKIVNREIVEAPKSTVLRTEVFKWIAGVISTTDGDKVHQVIHHLLAPLVREMGTTEESNAPLRHLAKEVGGLLKRKVGTDVYLSTMSKLQMQLNVRRAERKRERLQLAVTNPDIAAQKKIKLQVKKKDAKKRKIEMLKGKKCLKKRRKNVDLDEIM